MKKIILGCIGLMMLFSINAYAQNTGKDQTFTFAGEEYKIIRSMENGMFWQNTYSLRGKAGANKKITISYQKRPQDVESVLRVIAQSPTVFYTAVGNASNGLVYGTKEADPNNKYDQPWFYIHRVTPNVKVSFEYFDKVQTFDNVDKSGKFHEWVQEMLVWNIPPVVKESF